MTRSLNTLLQHEIVHQLGHQLHIYLTEPGYRISKTTGVLCAVCEDFGEALNAKGDLSILLAFFFELGEVTNAVSLSGTDTDLSPDDIADAQRILSSDDPRDKNLVRIAYVCAQWLRRHGVPAQLAEGREAEGVYALPLEEVAPVLEHLRALAEAAGLEPATSTGLLPQMLTAAVEVPKGAATRIGGLEVLANIRAAQGLNSTGRAVN